jgi:hypothetical protein
METVKIDKGKLYPSSRTMALGWTQPLTEMNARNHPEGKGAAGS